MESKSDTNITLSRQLLIMLTFDSIALNPYPPSNIIIDFLESVNVITVPPSSFPPNSPELNPFHYFLSCNVE
uniref:Uncharacterized protein n=1 Tax=Lepeophtheirus salmonis TaxID=72036 RepID=A0A0K2T372_LEPSM